MYNYASTLIDEETSTPFAWEETTDIPANEEMDSSDLDLDVEDLDNNVC